MATATNRGVDIHYETAGSGETVAFVGTAGYGAWQWSFQHGRVAGPCEALVYDHRGTGRSDAPSGPYVVGTLAADLEAVLADAGVDAAHLVGLGLGSAVALAYADDYTRAESLCLVGGAAEGETVDAAALDGLWAPLEDDDALAESLSGALSPAFRTGNPAVVERICDWRARDDAGRAGFEAQRAAWLGFDGPALYELELPALVAHGLEDPVVPADAGRALAAGLPRGEFLAVEGRHLVTVEAARALTDRLLGFVDDVSDG